MKKMRIAGLAALGTVWLLLTAFAWFAPAEEVSEAERRRLAQLPALTVDAVLDGSFMEDFEEYTLDQFPLRDSFRQLKAVFHYGVLKQGDNNGIYIADGVAAQLEYPLNGSSVRNAVGKLNQLYESYLKDSGSAVWLCVVPDKGYYLAEENGYPAMDYETLLDTLRQGTPWAEYVDLTSELEIGDYYATDTHWRQEQLTGVAEKLCAAMDAAAFEKGELQENPVERPFYGVYYGQAAIPMEPDTMFTLESDILSGCTVYNHETGKTTSVYDWEKLESRDLYDIYLSGAAALLTIHNPAGEAGKELIVFRDSFGSSLVPLLIREYSVVTVIDTRYIAGSLLGEYVDFHGQDVLMLYSTLVLNNSSSLK